MPEQLTIVEVQKEAERLLGVFDEFCREHGLQYFAAYGTLLGAVRHGGPIPWDDDVDVLMPRPDYDRLIGLYSDDSNDTRLFLPGAPDYPIYFVKFVSLRTSLIEESVHFPSDYGVFIDVFPLDGLPHRGGGLHLRRIDLLHRLFQASYHQRLPDVHPLPLQVRMRRAVGAIGRIVPRRIYLKWIERAMRRYPYESADRVAMLLSYLPLSTEVFDKQELEGESWLPYGELTIRSFAVPEPVLERNYGLDWRTPIKREAASHGIATWRV